ncbi:uncharacterized protein LOC134460040 [Engraulis encrasicolus]|uniref:uncharacterized protein LOC134460040 n=1 Tax=Engraulis encrasicolus TaxID=184585 RepID=UPI002FD37997
MQDQQTGPKDAKTNSQKLLERLLCEFNTSGTLDFSTYPSHIKLQSLYCTLNKLLLKSFASTGFCRIACVPKDSSFDDLLISALTKELLSQCDSEGTPIPSASCAPSAPGAPPPAHVVLPAHVCIAKEPQVSGGRPSSPTSVTSSPEITPKRPGREIFLKLKGALGSLQKPVARHPSHSGDRPAQCPMVADYGSDSHDLTCMAKTLEKLLSNGNIDNIAKGLVDQIQAVRQDRSSTQTTLDGKSTPESGSETAPQKTQSATQVVYSITEQAIKGLLQPYLLPLVEWNAGQDGCKLSGGTNDNGCLITGLLLRLLTKLQDQQTGPKDAKTHTQKLLECLINTSGTLNFSTYPYHIKLQSLYRTLNMLLLKNFGSQAILQKSVDANDSSFDDLLMSALTQELLNQCDTEVTTIPSAPGAPSAPGVTPPPEPQSGSTGSKTRKRWFSFKILKRRNKNRVSPSDATHPDTNQRHSADADVLVQRPRKRSMLMRLFTSCFKGAEDS